MKILLDITHPAFVHFFRFPIKRFLEAGHDLRITSRKKDVLCELLDEFRIPHTSLSRAGKSFPGLLCEMLWRDWNLFNVARQFKPNVLLAANGVYASHVGRLLGIPTVSFDFDDDARVQHWMYFPFATRVYTERSYNVAIGQKHRQYTGVFSLAYLHPKRFAIDDSIRNHLNIDAGERLIVCRLVSLTANHDVGHQGFDSDDLVDILQELSQFGRVLITSERPLNPILEPFRLAVRPDLLHQVLAQADLCIGESPTLAIESAVLGVPALYVGSRSVSYLEMLERDFGLVRCIRTKDECLKKSREFLTEHNLIRGYRERRDQYLAQADDLVDVVLSAVAEFDPERSKCTDIKSEFCSESQEAAEQVGVRECWPGNRTI